MGGSGVFAVKLYGYRTNETQKKDNGMELPRYVNEN